jgi:hypothetical protein
MRCRRQTKLIANVDPLHETSTTASEVTMQPTTELESTPSDAQPPSSEGQQRSYTNYRRGLFRSWLVLSTIWSAVILTLLLRQLDYVRPPICLFANCSGWENYYQWLYWSGPWSDWLAVIFAPWVWVGWVVGGWVVRWTVRGFRST